MTQPESTTIRRRLDGSIDISFYARRAAQERRVAIQALLANWFRYAARRVTPAGPSGATPLRAIPRRTLLGYTGAHNTPRHTPRIRA
ncbi:MAG: hypothetical protein WBA29_04845 [Xanthobacteraceae bacterium]